MFAYIGPETTLPVATALATVGGLLMLAGHRVRRVAGAVLRVFWKRSS